MPFVVYSLLRLGLVLAAAGVLWLVGARGWLLALLAVVVAVPLSYLLLRGRRDAAAVWLAERAERRRSAPEVRADDAEEDAAVARLHDEPGTDASDEAAPDGPTTR